MRKLSMVAVLFVLLLTAPGARAQNYNWLSETPRAQVTQANLDKQVEVLLQLFSSLSGSGFVNTASLHKVGGVDVRATFVGTPVPDEFKDIIPTVPNPLDSSVNFVPFAFLHGNVGLPANFEVYGRFFTPPAERNADIGKVTARDAQGRAMRMSGTNADVTDRKLREEELQRAKMEAEAVGREKQGVAEAQIKLAFDKQQWVDRLKRCSAKAVASKSRSCVWALAAFITACARSARLNARSIS